ncbi:nucleotide sugar transporter-KT 1 [Striga asiatica]|uniref:Nucleotide sugar transporter-KT 1 n=1 Tax=Striga asiatica TaxID=4170 RepID=A0A5A7NXK7_STRAF|nr:nucleotide sugar transporter-KT 1 [Striga asiatica]
MYLNVPSSLPCNSSALKDLTATNLAELLERHGIANIRRQINKCFSHGSQKSQFGNVTAASSLRLMMSGTAAAAAAALSVGRNRSVLVRIRVGVGVGIGVGIIEEILSIGFGQMGKTGRGIEVALHGIWICILGLTWTSNRDAVRHTSQRHTRFRKRLQERVRHHASPSPIHQPRIRIPTVDNPFNLFHPPVKPLKSRGYHFILRPKRLDFLPEILLIGRMCRHNVQNSQHVHRLHLRRKAIQKKCLGPF